nr:hypothetical protein BaRGS_022039 [Batillaria attramentaria]
MVVKRQPRQHFGRFHCLIRPPRALKPSSFEIRKNYKVPDQCLPPKPPPLKSTRKDPYTYDSPPVFVEIQTLSAGELAWVMWSNKKYDEFQQDLVNKNIRMANLYFQEPQLLHPMEIIKDLECPIV